MPYKATKAGLVLFYILAYALIVSLLIGAPFIYVNFRRYVFCLLVVLVKLSALAK